MGNPSTEFQALVQNKSKKELLELQSRIRKQPGVTATKLRFLIAISDAINSFNN